MLGLIGRAREAWRAKTRLLAPVWNMRPDMFVSPDLRFPELESILRAQGPELQPYEGLAAVWDEYRASGLPDYPAFLEFLAHRRGAALGSVLDLACGTGLLSERLAPAVGEVIGLDASERMLEIARARRGGLPGVSFARGDFRDFALGRRFDAVVCASNSLNYVADRGELARVFAAVSAHLRPGGVFVFDVTTEWAIWRISGLYLHVSTGERRFAIHFYYDRARGRETSLTILPTGLETHRRIPLEPADVRAAAKGTGLRVVDYFSRALVPRGWGGGCGLLFFVLSKDE